MMGKKDINIISDIEDMISDFRHRTGEDPSSVLNDLLDYIIGYLDPTGAPIQGWNHNAEENQKLYGMMIRYFELMEKQLGKVDWFDAFGDLIMSMRTKGGGFEQYFTPTGICNLMVKTMSYADLEMAKISGRYVISDPTCGSSRNLLAAHAKLIGDNRPAPYVVAEDIDILCCKISAVNLAVHGCFGEVVCHNTLIEPESLRSGYLVNHLLYAGHTGVPTITRSTDPSDFLACDMWKKRKRKSNQQLSLDF